MVDHHAHPIVVLLKKGPRYGVLRGLVGHEQRNRPDQVPDLLKIVDAKGNPSQDYPMPPIQPVSFWGRIGAVPIRKLASTP